MEGQIEFAAIICAAGSSTRMGGLKKEYRPLPAAAPLTVLGASVSAFAQIPCIGVCVITFPADDPNGEAVTRNALPPELLAREKPLLLFVPGGNTRRASVHNALARLTAYNPRYVLIHDGCRPWVSVSLIERIIKAVREYSACGSAGAVIPLLPLIETPKETGRPVTLAGENDSNAGPVFITRHLRRAVVGGAQTPQAFAFPEILQAHEQAAAAERVNASEFTDDAEVWGAFCGQVAAIVGESANRKITFPEDLVP
jgi:2-C-methyl-D-erythritol 4-phosphate cytidylyltransferase